MSVYTNDVDTLREAMSRSWPMIVSGSGHRFGCDGGNVHVYNWVMALLVLVITIPTTHVFFVGSPRRAANTFVSQQIALAKTNGYVEEMTNGQRVIKVFNYEESG
jgi:ATP-binding cassette subfamily B multidrug efflux pump